MRFFPISSAWIASLNTPALSQSSKKEVEMSEVAGSGVQKRHFAVLVELHSDLAKWLVLSNADGAHWQLCSRSALTQHCSTHTSPKALTLPLDMPLSWGQRETGRGTDPCSGGRGWQSCQTLTAVSHSLKPWVFWFMISAILCSVLLPSPLPTTGYAILYYTILYYTFKLYFIVAFNLCFCQFRLCELGKDCSS